MGLRAQLLWSCLMQLSGYPTNSCDFLLALSVTGKLHLSTPSYGKNLREESYLQEL